jgi:hypothetical protein
MKLFRLQNNEILELRIIKQTNTTIRYIDRQSGVEITEYRTSKSIQWFDSYEAANECRKELIIKEIDKIVSNIFALNQQLKEKKELLNQLK